MSSSCDSFLIISYLTFLPFYFDSDLNFTTLLALLLLLLSGAIGFLLHAGHPISNTPTLPVTVARKRDALPLGGEGP
jgi:hypothetical protein